MTGRVVKPRFSGVMTLASGVLPGDEYYVEATSRRHKSIRGVYVTVDGVVFNAWRSEFEDERCDS
jgi:hypothetical protein